MSAGLPREIRALSKPALFLGSAALPSGFDLSFRQYPPWQHGGMGLCLGPTSATLPGYRVLLYKSCQARRGVLRHAMAKCGWVGTTVSFAINTISGLPRVFCHGNQ